MQIFSIGILVSTLISPEEPMVNAQGSRIPSPSLAEIRHTYPFLCNSKCKILTIMCMNGLRKLHVVTTHPPSPRKKIVYVHTFCTLTVLNDSFKSTVILFKIVKYRPPSLQIILILFIYYNM